MRIRALVLFLLAAPGARSRAQVTGLEFHASSSVDGVAPASLVTRVTVTNHANAPVDLQFGDGALKLRGYRSPDKSGKPAWYSERAVPRFIKQTQEFSDLVLYEHPLAPGQSVGAPPFGLKIPTYEILADSLPEGRYYLTAELTLNEQTFTFDAGSAVISAHQELLPTSRTLTGIEFSSSVRRKTFGAGNSDSLDLTFTVHNTSATTHRLVPDLNGGSGCIYMGGYEDRAVRDAYYLKPAYAADWIARPCPLKAPPYVELLPGESQSFTNRVAAPLKPLRYIFAFEFWMDGAVGEEPTIEGDLAADEHSSR